MNDAMPYYYRVTENHGAGAELVMDAEASFLRGDFEAARLLNARARCRASENKQLFLLLCCDFLALRLALAEGGDASLSESEETLLRQRRDATLLLSLDAVHAYAAALDDRPERIPPRFADHMLKSVNILRPARPMLLMIENQVYLAQKQYEAVIGRSDTLLALCREMHYALTELHVRIQTAAAYGMLGRTADARSLLTEALALAEPDGLLMPFAENFRLLETPLEMLAKENAAARRAASLGAQWKAESDARRARNAPGEPAACLTEREAEIARLAAARATNREIAEKLYLSEGTVKQYINQIYAKLHIDGDTRTKRQRLADTLRKN